MCHPASETCSDACIGFSTFLPTIIKDLGDWTVAETQLLTVPCYFLGAAAYMSTAFLSDKLQRRGLFCVIFGLISCVGYAVLLADVSSGAHYFGCFLVAGGLYVVVGLPLAWVSYNNNFVTGVFELILLVAHEFTSLWKAHHGYRHAADMGQCGRHHVCVHLVSACI